MHETAGHASGKHGKHQGHKRSLSPTSERVAALVENSPFIDLNHPINGYEALKLFLMFPVVILKWAVLAVAVVYSWSVLLILLAGAKRDQPLGPLRSRIVGAWIKIWASFLLLVCGFYKIPVRGWHHLTAARASRAIIVFNHESYVDPPIIVALFAPCGVAKSGVARIPFFSTFATALQFLFVERKGAGDTANSLTLRHNPAEAVAQRAADPRYPLLMIAPEATTKARPCLLKFRRGAFAAGRPVIPVLLRYPCRHFYPGWGVPWSTALHVWRLMSQIVNHAEVEILPVYYPSENEKEDPGKFAGNVRELMAERLKVPRVDQGVAEVHALVKAGVSEDAFGDRVLGVPSSASSSTTQKIS